MLAQLFESFYNKIFINIIVERSSTVVHIEIHNKSEEIEHTEQRFETTKLSSEMYEFIDSYLKESPYYYIIFLDTSIEQGALPTCEKNKLSYYKDLTTCEYKCIDKNWTIYTSKTDLYALEKKYEHIGIDFIFSPFVVLGHFFSDKIDKSLALYVLIEDESIAVAIFEHSKLLYAEYLDMEVENETEKILLEDDESFNDDVELDLGEGIDLDALDVDDNIEDVDGFADIEDLDALEDIEEFSENKDIEEELLEAEDDEQREQQNSNATDTHFNEDYQRFSLIQGALNHFYKDEKYESKFVENVYIADYARVSNDLKHYLEEEMFLNVYIRSVDLGEQMTQLAKRELGL